MFWLECLTCRLRLDENKENERNGVNIHENFILFQIKQNYNEYFKSIVCR